LHYPIINTIGTVKRGVSINQKEKHPSKIAKKNPTEITPASGK